MTNTIGERSIKAIVDALPGTKCELMDKTGLHKRTLEYWLSMLTNNRTVKYTLVEDSRGRLQSKRYYEKGNTEPLNSLFMR